MSRAGPVDTTVPSQNDAPLYKAKNLSFMVLNSSMGWCRLSASPLCVSQSCFQMQKLPSATVLNVFQQSNALQVFKSIVTSISLLHPAMDEPGIGIAIFPDARQL